MNIIKKTKQNTTSKIIQSRQGGMIYYFMLLPAITIVVIMTALPLLYSLALSATNYNLSAPKEIQFVGLQNYITMLTDPNIQTSIGNTLFYTITSVAISIVIGLFLAVVVNNIRLGKSFFRIAIFAPMMLSAVVIGVIWKFLLNNQLGIICFLLSIINIKSPDWLGSSGYAMFTVILVDVWQWTSYVFLLCLASLEALNTEPVESARIDGANGWQIFWNVKFPTILPVLQVAAIFRFTWAFRGFDTIFALTKGGPGIATETMALSIWKYAFKQYDIGLASSLSMFMFLLLMTMAILILNKTFRKEGK